MRIALLTGILAFVFCATFVSCDHTIKTVTVQIHNRSGYELTDVGVSPGDYWEKIEKGKSVETIGEWVNSKSFRLDIDFTRNQMIHRIGRRVHDGDIIILLVFDDKWEW